MRSASTQALTTPSNGIIWPETKRQVRPAWAPCSCVLVLSRTDKEGHNTVKLVRQRSPKQHPKGCWGLLGLESRQFFEEEPVTNLDIVEKAHIDRAEEPTCSKTVSEEERECRAYLAEFASGIGLRSSDGRVGNENAYNGVFWGTSSRRPTLQSTPHSTLDDYILPRTQVGNEQALRNIAAKSQAH